MMSSKPRVERTSILLRRILAGLPESSVTVDYLLGQLGRRSFGGIVVILAALGLIPGISILVGLVMTIVGFQMLAGFKAPRLPKLLGTREFNSGDTIAIGEKIIVGIETLESWVKPRWSVLTMPPISSIVGVVTMGLGLVIMIPLPFTNFPPALALLLLSVGQLERDGIVISVGLIVAALALVMGGFLASFAISSLIGFLA